MTDQDRVRSPTLLFIFGTLKPKVLVCKFAPLLHHGTAWRAEVQGLVTCCLQGLVTCCLPTHCGGSVEPVEQIAQAKAIIWPSLHPHTSHPARTITFEGYVAEFSAHNTHQSCGTARRVEIQGVITCCLRATLTDPKGSQPVVSGQSIHHFIADGSRCR